LVLIPVAGEEWRRWETGGAISFSINQTSRRNRPRMITGNAPEFFILPSRFYMQNVRDHEV
jgi:hypothetical protein